MPTVKDLIEALSEYNPDAVVSITTTGYPEPFSIAYGGDEGATMERAKTVSFYVENAATTEAT